MQSPQYKNIKILMKLNQEDWDTKTKNARRTMTPPTIWIGLMLSCSAIVSCLGESRCLSSYISLISSLLIKSFFSLCKAIISSRLEAASRSS